jgi:hypothetical protein
MLNGNSHLPHNRSNKLHVSAQKERSSLTEQSVSILPIIAVIRTIQDLTPTKTGGLEFYSEQANEI